MSRARPLLTSTTTWGWIGIVLGFLAFWVTSTQRDLFSGTSLAVEMPVRTPIPTGILALAATVIGAIVIARGSVKLGIFAIAAAAIGGTLGWLATSSSVEHLGAVVAWSGLIGAMLRYSTPLVFAAIGGMFSERSGVVNIGLEGMMLMGAFFGIMGAEKTGSWELGLVIGVLAGAALASVHALFSITLRTDQIVGGTAINFLALGITGYVFIDQYGLDGVPAEGLPEIPDVNLGFLSHLPDMWGIGPLLQGVLGEVNGMIWAGIALVFLSWAVLFKTPVGLRIRACGEHPGAADTAGISVYGVRYAAVIASGMLAAAGGVYLSIGFGNSFTENMTGGRGFIALAALIFGGWRPFGAWAACLLFGFSSAVADRLPVYAESAGIPIDVLFKAFPYVVTLIAVAGVIGRTIPPAAVGRPYVKQ